MKKERIFLSFLLALLCIGAVSLWAGSSRAVRAVHEDLSSHILRFHVLANSDSEEDQALKLSVRTAVLDYLEESLPEDSDLASTKAFLASHEAEIQKIAEDLISSAGFDYQVSLSLEPWYFPTKAYGDLTFPCGTYDAFRIIIGDGDGKNWWCVLYPSLCFVDTTCGIVPEDSKEELQAILDEDTYETLLPSEKSPGKPSAQTTDKSSRPQIRFRLAEWLAELF
ncbi:MAG: stage II sporulation protein R [Lachnospiraceae bacterium]|jgi:stage II sporulation protein R|nr:stage II sporulation protein R [Lachnospiraceae bacterium]